MLATMHFRIRAATFLCGLTVAATVCKGQGRVFAVDREQARLDAVAARANWKRFTATFARKDGDRFLVRKLFATGKSAVRKEELLWVIVSKIEKD